MPRILFDSMGNHMAMNDIDFRFGFSKVQRLPCLFVPFKPSQGKTPLSSVFGRIAQGMSNSIAILEVDDDGE